MKGRYSRLLLAGLALLVLATAAALLRSRLGHHPHHILLRDAAGQTLQVNRVEALNSQYLALCGRGEVWLGSSTGQALRKLTDCTEVVPQFVQGPDGAFAVIDIPMDASFRQQPGASGDIPGWIRFFDAEGHQLAEHALAMPCFSNQFCRSGDTLAFASGGKLSCCDFSGRLLWEHELGKALELAPEPGPQGELLCAVPDGEGQAVRLSAAGKLLWSVTSPLPFTDPHQMAGWLSFRHGVDLLACDEQGNQLFKLQGNMREPYRPQLAVGDHLICQRGEDLLSIDAQGHEQRIARLGQGYTHGFRADAAGRLWLLFNHEQSPINTQLHGWLPLAGLDRTAHDYNEILIFDAGLRLRKREIVDEENRRGSTYLASLPDGAVAVLAETELLVYAP